MYTDQLFDWLPFWALFVGTIVVVLLSLDVGFRLGRRERRRRAPDGETPAASTAAATLGLLALMLGFTFGMAVSRFDARKQLVLDEANAIGTAYLRAELLPQPYGADIQRLLREYVEVRLEGIQPGRFEGAMARSEALHDLLWSQAIIVGEQHPSSVMAGLFIHSLNEVIDLHAKRVTTGVRNRIPGIVWGGLYLVSSFAMLALGYHAGLSGSGRSSAVMALTLGFTVVLLLIADLDRPQAGLARVGQQALVDVQSGMLRRAR